MFLVLMKPLNSLTSQRRYTLVLHAPCTRIRRSSRFLQPHSGLVHWPLSPSANLCYPWSVFSNSRSLMDLVSAGTGCVGLRCPSHPLARKLISTVIYLQFFDLLVGPSPYCCPECEPVWPCLPNHSSTCLQRFGRSSNLHSWWRGNVWAADGVHYGSIVVLIALLASKVPSWRSKPPITKYF